MIFIENKKVKQFLAYSQLEKSFINHIIKKYDIPDYEFDLFVNDIEIKNNSLIWYNYTYETIENIDYINIQNILKDINNYIN
jgi:hypothetical protein